jgi:predicted aspartyl protease
MKMKIFPDRPITLFVHITGNNGKREMRAVIDTASQYCIIPLQDALQLDCIEHFSSDPVPGERTRMVTNIALLEANEIVLNEVSVADVVAKNVKTLAYNMTRQAGIEAVLGLSFLQQFKTVIDYEKGYLTIEPFASKE